MLCYAAKRLSDGRLLVINILSEMCVFSVRAVCLFTMNSFLNINCALFVRFFFSSALSFGCRFCLYVSFFFLLMLTHLFHRMDSISSNDSNSIRHLHKNSAHKQQFFTHFFFAFFQRKSNGEISFIFSMCWDMCVNVCFRCSCHAVVTLPGCWCHCHWWYEIMKNDPL